MLAIVAFLAPDNPNAVADAVPLWQKIGVAALSLVVLIATGIWLLNPLFKILAKSKAREVMTAAALLVVLGAAYLMELGGLSMAMGAFLAECCCRNPTSVISLKRISNRSEAFCSGCFLSCRDVAGCGNGAQ